MKAVIVSAFMANINNQLNYTVDKYIENGKLLIHIQTPKIIFIEREIYEKYFTLEVINHDLTKFIMFEKKEIYLYDHISKVTNFNIHGDKNKDTLEYMLTICHKTEWIKKAIELNLYDSDQYVWIDFGIYYIIKELDLFENSILNITKKTYSKIRIASCWNPNIYNKIDLFKYINWYFAGGTFGGNKESLITFANLMKYKCLSIIQERKTIMWEVNIWYLIYIENPYLFDAYSANHNVSILTNY